LKTTTIKSTEDVSVELDKYNHHDVIITIREEGVNKAVVIKEGNGLKLLKVIKAKRDGKYAKAFCDECGIGLNHGWGSGPRRSHCGCNQEYYLECD